jgi:hypothetical protein
MVICDRRNGSLFSPMRQGGQGNPLGFNAGVGALLTKTGKQDMD